MIIVIVVIVKTIIKNRPGQQARPPVSQATAEASSAAALSSGLAGGDKVPRPTSPVFGLRPPTFPSGFAEKNGVLTGKNGDLTRKTYIISPGKTYDFARKRCRSDRYICLLCVLLANGRKAETTQERKQETCDQQKWCYSVAPKGSTTTVRLLRFGGPCHPDRRSTERT